MASTYLTKTFGSAGNRKTWTFSAWIKKTALDVEQNILMGGNTSYNDAYIRITGGNQLRFLMPDGTTTVGTLNTTQVLRDTSAWYHIVCVYDSSNATSSERMRIYINGNRITDFSTELYPSQNQDSFNINNASPHYIGAKHDATTFFDGSMSHIHFIDGTVYTPSAFGETDANGVWKIKTDVSVTYGTNGFFILKDSASVTDQSGNGNNFTIGGGTLTDTLDCPDDVFATLSGIDKYAAGLSNGATTVTNENNTSTIVLSTLAVNSGKWYWEAKVENSTSGNFNVGIKKTGQNNYGVVGSAYNSTGWVYATDGNIYHGGSSILNTGTTSTVGDIIGFILDMDAGTLKLKKNGSDIYSGNAVVSSLNTGEHYHVVQGAADSIVSFNFGNGYFGTTAVSSAGTNASGIGIFEYDVPTGYTALSTKGLNL